MHKEESREQVHPQIKFAAYLRGMPSRIRQAMQPEGPPENSFRAQTLQVHGVRQVLQTEGTAVQTSATTF